MDPWHVTFKPKWTARQTLAFDTLARDDVKEVLYGGAKGAERVCSAACGALRGR